MICLTDRSYGTELIVAQAYLRVILQLLTCQYQLFKSEVILSIFGGRLGNVTSGRFEIGVGDVFGVEMSGGFRLESPAGLGV